MRPLFKDIPDIVETYEALASKGSDITGMFPLAWDSFLRVIDLDCVFVNSTMIDTPAAPGA